MGSRPEEDEELRSISVRSCVRHRQNTRMRVRDPNLFISELISIYALTPSSILISSVTSLSHEPFDHSMEHVLFVVIKRPFVTHTNRSEILCGFRYQFGEDLEHHPSILFILIIIITNLYVKEGLNVIFVESG